MATKDISFHRYSLGSLLPDVTLPESVAAVPVAALTVDSRAAEPGSLFFAIPGTNQNGLSFIEAAVQAGAVAVICQDAQVISGVCLSWHTGATVSVPVIGVRDVRSTVGKIAAQFFGNPSLSMQVTGVTGTNGKSTCVSLLAQLQQLLGTKSAVIGTLGFGIVDSTGSVGALHDVGMTTPDAITCQRILRELADQQVKAVAMEVSSHGLVQKRVAGTRMTTGIFTNVTRDHLDYHGDMHSYMQAKAQLFGTEGLQHAVINLDDEQTASCMMAAVQPGAQIWTYSTLHASAQVYATRIKLHSQGISALVCSPWGTGELNSVLLGQFNLYNLLAVITAACAQGADFDEVINFVPQLQPVKGRMQTVDRNASVRVLIDYAHTPDALRQALRALRAHSEKKIHLVFGCGGDRDSGKRPEMAAVAEAHADHVVVTTDNPRTESCSKIIEEICSGFVSPHNADVIVDRAEAIAFAIESAADGDLVLIAGKGHENYQIVGLERLPFDDESEARAALANRKHMGASR